MTLVIEQGLAGRLLGGEEGRTPAELWGRSLDGRDVLRIVSLAPEPGLEKVGHWVVAADASGSPVATSDRSLAVLHRENGVLAARRGGAVEDVEVVRLRTDLFARQRGILESSLLADRKVVVLGLGSMGASVARDLAMTGVGRFVVVDKDRLSVSNVSRHAGGLADVGRRKTRVVADLIRDRNPEAVVDEVDADFSRMRRAESGRLLEGADLAICTADEKPARLKLAELAVKQGVGHVFTGCWERARAGLAFYWMPGWEGPCYCCFLDKWESRVRRRATLADYSSSDDVFHLPAQPGLQVDIGYVSLVTTKVALQLLCLGRVPPEQLDLLNPDRTLFLVGNRSTEEFSELPLQVRFAETERQPGCRLCGRPQAVTERSPVPAEPPSGGEVRDVR